MTDQNTEAKGFPDLLPEDTDLTMFTIQNLNLSKKKQLVILTMVLKRKVATELLTTYLPTILLLLITLVTIFFDKDLFSNVIAVNLIDHHPGDDHHLHKQDRGAAPHL